MPVWTDPLEQVGIDFDAIESFLHEQVVQSATDALEAAEVDAAEATASIAVFVDLPLELILLVVVGIILAIGAAIVGIVHDWPVVGGRASDLVNLVLSPVRQNARTRMSKVAGNAQYAHRRFKQMVFHTVPGLDWEHMPNWFTWATHTMQDLWNQVYNAHHRITVVQGGSNATIRELEQTIAQLDKRATALERAISAFIEFEPRLSHEIDLWGKALTKDGHDITNNHRDIVKLNAWTSKQGAWDQWESARTQALRTWIDKFDKTYDANVKAFNQDMVVLEHLTPLLPVAALSKVAIGTLLKVAKDPCHCFTIPGSTGEIALALAAYDWWIAE